SRRRRGARNVLILRIGAVMSNSLCSNGLVGPSGVSASAKGGRIAVACGSRALPQVLRARNALSAPTRNARCHQSVTHVPTRHGTCYASPLGYEQCCVLVSLVRSEEHTSELQSLAYLVCRLLLEKKKISS